MQSLNSSDFDRLPNRHFLTAAELAPWLRVDERTVRRMAERWQDSGGQEGLPAFKVGRQWRFARERILPFLGGNIGRLISDCHNFGHSGHNGSPSVCILG